MEINEIFAEAILDYELNAPINLNIQNYKRAGLLNTIVNTFPQVAEKLKYRNVNSIRVLLSNHRKTCQV